MHFELDPETQLARDSLRRFLKTEVLPVEEKDKQLFDGRVTPEVMRVGAEIRRKSIEAGFYTVHMPEALGGGGLSHVAVTALREEIARSGSKILGLFVIGDPPMGPTPMLSLLDEAQRDKWLRPLMTGEKTTCFALTEPNAGSDVARIETFAKKDGGWYVLNGSKVYVSNGLGADFLQVFAVTERGKGMMGGISLFMVDAGSPGLTRRLMRSMAGDDFQAEIVFDDVRIPKGNLVGEEGFGFLGATQWLSGERLMMAIQAVGLAEHALELGVEWAKTRRAFDKTIGKFQGVSFPLADCATEVEAARWLTYRTAWLLDQGDSAMKELAMSKVFAAEVLGRTADQVLQALGGAGYMSDHPIERVYRIARVFRIGGGTSEIQRRLIASSLGI